MGINIIDKEYRDQEEGEKAEDGVDRVWEAARGSNNGLIEGYKESDDGERENVRDEFPFLLEN